MRSLWLALSILFSVCAAHAEGGRLATDDVVRTEMKTIRDLTLGVRTEILQHRLLPADARMFHERVTASVGRLKAKTQMEGEARDEIEKLAGYIERGASEVAGGDPATALDGILIVDDSLSIYARRFDHPGWQPLP